MIVHFTSEARAAVRVQRAWWEQHRDKAPQLFRDEQREAVAMLRTAPKQSAQTYAVLGGRVIWRRLMPKTRHHIYFGIDEAAGVVEVLTVWNAQGGANPDFSF